jgi:hypothetical protein
MISELRELPQLRMRVGSESDAVALRPGLESEADPALNSFVTGVHVLSGHAPNSRRRFGPAHGMARPRQNCICPRFLNPRSKSRNTFSALHGSRRSVHAPKAHPVHPTLGNASREPRPRRTCGPSKGRNPRTPIARAGRAPSEFRPCRADCMAESGRPGRCPALVNSHPDGALERRAGGAAIHPTARQSGCPGSCPEPVHRRAVGANPGAPKVRNFRPWMGWVGMDSRGAALLHRPLHEGEPRLSRSTVRRITGFWGLPKSSSASGIHGPGESCGKGTFPGHL